jgi:hypothetical protein
MSAKDKFHEEVKRALIKDQWTVTRCSSFLNLKGETQYF